MALAIPNLKYSSGDFTIAKPVTLPEFSAPFGDIGVNVDYLLTQEWEQDINSFAALALDTPHPDFADFLLVRESEKKSAGGSRVRWTRTYAKQPADFSRPGGTYPYVFPALVSSAPRPVTRQNVQCRIQRDFFHTATPSGIAEIEAQRFVLDSDPNTDATDATGAYPAVADATAFSALTLPSLTNYLAMIGLAVEIVAESKIVQWNGNFWMRETTYVKAQ